VQSLLTSGGGESIWKSAQKSNPTASLTDEALENGEISDSFLGSKNGVLTKIRMDVVEIDKSVYAVASLLSSG
jgi:hypothetical protein